MRHICGTCEHWCCWRSDNGPMECSTNQDAGWHVGESANNPNYSCEEWEEREEIS